MVNENRLSFFERFFRSILGFSLFSIVVVLCFVVNIFQIILLPISLQSVRVRHYSNSFFAGTLWWLCQIIFHIMGGRVEVFADDLIDQKESALVISNHCTFADFFLLHEIAVKQRMIWFCRYFSKDSVKWIPFFGWGIRLMGMIMLKRDWLQDEKRIYSTFSFYTKHILPIWLISYSEGSRRSAEKLKSSQEYALANGRTALNHVLLPRTRGFAASVKALSGVISAVYDFTLVYYKKPTTAKDGIGKTPSTWDYLSANLGQYVFEVHIKRFPITQISINDEKNIAEWLHGRFREKDKLLESRYNCLSGE